MTDSDYDIIDSYLSGSLSEAERMAFEERLMNDDSFSHELESYRQMHLLIIEQGLASDAVAISQFYEKIDKRKNRKYWLIGIGLFFSAFTFIYINSSKDEKLDEENPSDSIQLKNVIAEQIVSPSEEKKEIDSSENLLNSSVFEPSSSINLKEELTIIQLDEIKEQDFGTAEQIDQKKISKLNVPKKDLKNKDVDATENPESACNSLNWILDIVSEPSCENDNTGAIVIYAIQGGNPPYKVSLGDSIVRERVGNLKSGKYNLVINDSDNCRVDKQVSIESEFCDNPYDLTFSVAFSQECLVPLRGSFDQVTLEVYDRSGGLIKSKLFSSDQVIAWDGTNNKGKQVDIGVYPFLLKKSSGHTIKGTINVIP